jgi:hypothetical protein
MELDNSAAFLGVRSDVPEIARIVYTSSEPMRAFGINPVSLATSIPEPSHSTGLLVLGIGGVAIVFQREKRRS